jgi:PAS domain S-box-containing protein
MGRSSLRQPAPTPGGKDAPAPAQPAVHAEQRLPLAVLALAAGLVAVLSFLPGLGPGRGDGGDARDVASAAAWLAAALAFWRAGRSTGGAAPRWGAWASLVAALLRLVELLQRGLTGSRPAPEAAVATAGVLAVLLLGLLAAEAVRHAGRRWPELAADATLLAVLVGAAAFYALRADGAGEAGWTGSLAAGVAALATLAVAGWTVLAVWSPAPAHGALLACALLGGAAAVAVDRLARAGWPPDGLLRAEGTVALAALAAAATAVLQGQLDPDREEARPPALLGPWLLALALLGTAVAVASTSLDPGSRPRLTETAVLSVVVLLVAGGRAFVQLVGMVRSAGAMARALEEREGSIAALQAAAEELLRSEARHRQLLDSAVDGIVELDHRDRIVRVNRAFCAMARLPEERLVGRTWQEVAQMAGDQSGSLARLPETGTAVLEREAGPVYLEARASRVATDPPGTLLLIRDVTASRIAEQTIRQLFHFLQERDEDRARILQRTNAAIEVERNRIARDLHDGPVQGISAASLSLETARLLLEAGDTARAAQILQEVTANLSEEALNLRRIMRDLRPPLLDERGLAAAVQDLCARLQRELGIEVRVEARIDVRIPQDVETLAYRVVQEALSNVAKHSGASRVVVRLKGAGSILNVEVEDDGRGFDPGASREFLRAGKVGLASMRERAELAGGSLAVRSEPGRGTVVMASLPFEVLPPSPAVGQGE